MSSRTFRPETDQVGEARHFVLDAVEPVTSTDDGRVKADLALLTSEAVANAVEHAGTDIDVTITRVGPSSYRVSVHDDSPAPIPGPASPGSMTSKAGRGLTIIDAVAASWGVDDDAEDGKTIWFVATAP